ISASFQVHDAEAEAVKNKAAEEKLEEREMVSMGHEDKTFDPRDKAVAHESAVPRPNQLVALDIPEGPSSFEVMRRRADEVVVDPVFDDDAVDASFLATMEDQVDLTHDGGQAVDSDARTIDLVKRNEWYNSQVKYTLVSPGYKYNLLKKAYKQAMSKWEDEYEYIWALDSDIDFTGADLIELFSLARSSGSLIVGPTFAGMQSWLTYTMSMQEVTAHGSIGSIGSIGSGSMVRRDQSDFQTRINVLGKPDPRCKLRHTDFVEMTAPLLSSKVRNKVREDKSLRLLKMKDCVDCVHDKAEWGLDRVWCKLAQKLLAQTSKPCALLDAAPVQHLDWKKALTT
ncbi:unnamed protein product, partial [Cladocopium goreaui]